MKRILYFILMLSMFACQTREVQVVEDVNQDGTPKKVVDYILKGSDSIPQHEVQYHEGGAKLMEGSFANGKREGEWVSWFPDGQVWSKGYFKNGKRDGKSWVYHPNGQLYMKGEYKDGEKIGLWLVFNEDGIVIGKKTYE
jgi:antitoxin component YwqK of YwqJK toxin-antitoxin module